MSIHIKHLLDEFLKKKEKELNWRERIERITGENLDSETRKYIRLKKISKNQIIFYSNSSSSTYSFNLKKDKILEEIKKEFPDIKSIKIEYSL